MIAEASAHEDAAVWCAGERPARGGSCEESYYRLFDLIGLDYGCSAHANLRLAPPSGQPLLEHHARNVRLRRSLQNPMKSRLNDRITELGDSGSANFRSRAQQGQLDGFIPCSHVVFDGGARLLALRGHVAEHQPPGQLWLPPWLSFPAQPGFPGRRPQQTFRILFQCREIRAAAKSRFGSSCKRDLRRGVPYGFDRLRSRIRDGGFNYGHQRLPRLGLCVTT